MRIAFCLLCGPLVLGGCTTTAKGVSIATVTRVTASELMQSQIAEMSVTTDMPTTGDAKYAGYIGASATISGQSEALSLLANSTLTADFLGGSVTGNFDNLVSVDGSVTSGSGAIGGTISGAGLEASLAGTFIQNTTEYTLDGTLSADFHGAEAAAINGVLTGTLHDGADPAGSIDGGLWAQQ